MMYKRDLEIKNDISKTIKITMKGSDSAILTNLVKGRYIKYFGLTTTIVYIALLRRITK